MLDHQFKINICILVFLEFSVYLDMVGESQVGRGLEADINVRQLVEHGRFEKLQVQRAKGSVPALDKHS